MNYADFGKSMENVRKHREVKLFTKNERNYFVSEPNYHKQSFSQNIYSNRNEKKTQIIMNKPFYLGFSILELSKILLYEFWHDYVKPKYGERAKLCYMDTDIYCQIYTVLLYT